MITQLSNTSGSLWKDLSILTGVNSSQFWSVSELVQNTFSSYVQVIQENMKENWP